MIKINTTDDINTVLQSIKNIAVGAALPDIEGTFWKDISLDPPILKMRVGQQWMVIDTDDINFQQQLITKLKQTLDQIKPGSGDIFGKMQGHDARLWLNELLNVDIQNQPPTAALINMLIAAQEYLKNKG